jgi:RNA polymerase sigma-70 factor, ECF subfamily
MFQSGRKRSMTESEHDRIEREVRAAWDARRYDVATSRFLEHYGPEILGYVCAQLRNEADAGDAFGDFTEDFWRGLPRFEWRCSVRGWGYMLARHAAARVARSPSRRRDRNLRISEQEAIAPIVARIRTQTATFLRTDTKDRIRKLRERLPEDEQTLLILRLDRGLSWRDLAVVLSDETLQSSSEIERVSARLRQRFHSTKEKLKAMARKEGLL